LAPFLTLSSIIDRLNAWLGKLVIWLILASVLISAVNAIMRKVFSVSSNAYLEVQWYLYSAVFMLGVGWVFLHNGHVRIDFISARLSKRANAIIDAVAIVVFILPLCVLMIDLSWPYFLRTYESGEMSENAGGLIRWPVVALIPLGFAVMFLQSISELIKRLAFLTGARDEPFSFGHEKTAEEEFAEEMAAAADSGKGAR
jgi:TRAP-type mannitol/chloroaromatic compound transport system permease small subunit